MCSRRLSWLLGTLFLLMACGFAQPPPPPPDVAHMASLDQLAPMLTDPSADLRAGAARRLGQLNDTHAAPLLLARLADDAPAVRAAAALALAEMKDAAITPALLAKLHDKDDGVRTCATTALVRRHDPAVLPLLRTAAIDPDTAYRTAALTALSRLHDTQSVTLLCTALHDAATDARVAAAHGLGRLPASEIAIATLLATLADPDLKVRDAAAEALAAYGAPAAIPALVTALHDPARHLTDAPGLLRRFGDSGADAVLAALQAEQNVTVQQIYLAALGTLQSPRSLEPLAALLKSPTPAIAGGALDALIRSRAPGSIYTLTALHEEIFGPVKPFATGRTPRLRMPWTTDPRVVDALRVALPTGGGRIQAAGYFNDPTLITALAALAKTNPDLQRAIIPALSESGDARGLEPLLALAKSPDWGLAFAAGMALQQLNDIPNPTPLLTTLSDPNTGNAKRAIDALGVQADARAVPALLEVLKGEQPIDVKVSAALALGKIGDARAYEPLLAALQNWPAAQRGDAAQALGTLGDARAIEPLAAALVGADALTRLRIGAGLLKLGDTRGRDELLAALQGGNQLTQGLAGLALLDAHEPKAFDAGLAMLTAPAVDRNTRNLVLYYMAREGDARTVPLRRRPARRSVLDHADTCRAGVHHLRHAQPPRPRRGAGADAGAGGGRQRGGAPASRRRAGSVRTRNGPRPAHRHRAEPRRA